MRDLLIAFGATSLMFIVKWFRESLRREHELRPVRQEAALEILREQARPVSSFELCRLVDKRAGGGLAPMGPWLRLMDELCESHAVRKVWRERGPGEPRWFGYEVAS